MSEWKEWPQPTPEQQQQAERVQHAVCNELNLLAREGISAPVLVAGVGAAIADLITCTHGAHAVALWFDAQAKMIASLQGPPH